MGNDSNSKTVQSTAVTRLEQKTEPGAKRELKPIEKMVYDSTKQLGNALPPHMKPERIVRLALTTLRLNPKLYACEPMSFLGALFQAAQLGLEPNIDGQCYIIPYNVSVKVGNDWTKKLVANFQIG